MSVSIADRLARRSETQANGCVLWTGTQSGTGYGAIAIDRRQRLVHRVAFELHNGKISPGMSICHRCDTPLCLNPDHLFEGTPADNNADRDAKNRTSRGDMGRQAKLTAGNVADIKRRSDDWHACLAANPHDAHLQLEMNYPRPPKTPRLKPIDARRINAAMEGCCLATVDRNGVRVSHLSIIEEAQ